MSLPFVIFPFTYRIFAVPLSGACQARRPSTKTRYMQGTSWASLDPRQIQKANHDCAWACSKGCCKSMLGLCLCHILQYVWIVSHVECVILPTATMPLSTCHAFLHICWTIVICAMLCRLGLIWIAVVLRWMQASDVNFPSWFPHTNSTSACSNCYENSPCVTKKLSEGTQMLMMIAMPYRFCTHTPRYIFVSHCGKNLWRSFLAKLGNTFQPLRLLFKSPALNSCERHVFLWHSFS